MLKFWVILRIRINWTLTLRISGNGKSSDQNPYNENLYEVGLGVGNTGDVGTLMGWEVQQGFMYGQQGMGSKGVTYNSYYFYSFGKTDKRRDVTLTFGRYVKRIMRI